MECTRENVIEWISGDDTITVTLSQKRFSNRVLALKEKCPDKVDIISENDGSVLCARMPLEFLPLFREPTKRELTEEEREEKRERLKEIRREHGLGEFRESSGEVDEESNNNNNR